MKNRSSRWLAFAFAVLATTPPVAQAAVPDYRAGEQTDPIMDASLAFDTDTGAPDRLLDIQEVRADYDAGTGALNFFFEGDDLYNGTHASIRLYATISAPNPITGRCDRTLRDGDFNIYADGWRGYDLTEEAFLTNSAGDLVAQGYVEWPGNGATPHIAFKAPSLLRRDYRCVSGIYGLRGTSSHRNLSRDDVEDFCLATCPTGPTDQQPPPPAPKDFRATGTTLRWDPVSGARAYVVATSDLPEGAPGRRTTYVTVKGTSFDPPAVPGSTRYYGVRADLPNSRWTTPEVSITYPAPPRDSGGATPGTPAPGREQSAGVNRGITPVDNSRGPGVRTLTAAKARTAARKALAARYGRAFKRRGGVGYALRCVPSHSRAVCDVKWRYNGRRYKGKVHITRTDLGDIWRTAITRTRVRR